MCSTKNKLWFAALFMAIVKMIHASTVAKTITVVVNGNMFHCYHGSGACWFFNVLETFECCKGRIPSLSPV